MMQRIKVHAYGPDGSFGAGFFALSDYEDCPRWFGGKVDGAYETLFAIPRDDGSTLWVLYHHVEPQVLEEFGPGNVVDRSSYARVLTDAQAKKWFARKPFDPPEALNSDQRPRSARPTEEDKKLIRELLATDPPAMQRQIGDLLGVNQSQISRWIRRYDLGPRVGSPTVIDRRRESNPHGRSPGQRGKRATD